MDHVRGRGAPQASGTAGKPGFTGGDLAAGLHEAPSSSRASSDIMSMPQGGSQVSSTSTCFTPSSGSTASATQPGIRVARDGQPGAVQGHHHAHRVVGLDVDGVDQPQVEDVDRNLGGRRPTGRRRRCCRRAGGPVLDGSIEGPFPPAAVAARSSGCAFRCNPDRRYKERRGARKGRVMAQGGAAISSSAPRRSSGARRSSRASSAACVRRQSGSAALSTERPASVRLRRRLRRSCGSCAMSTQPARR